jgi:RNA polymerase sigma factor FliA
MTKTSCAEIEVIAPPAESRATARELWRRYRKTSTGSVTEGELIEQYLPLVKSVAGRLAMTLPPQVEAEDLYSAGLVGLVNAIRNFNPANGASFETYGRIRIRGAMFDELRRMDWVPRSVRDKARKIKSVMQQIEQVKGTPPSEQEMAAALNISVTKYFELLDEIRPTTFISLDATGDMSGEDETTEHESVADLKAMGPDETAAQRDLVRLISDRIQELPEVQQKVLALYYYEGLRLREIAEAFGLTESRICQIHAQAILAIRSFVHQLEPKEV